MGKNSSQIIVKTALIVGATGLIGNQLLQILLQDERYSSIKAITRKPITIVHPRLVNIVTDFERIKNFSEQLRTDDVFCCLGTTIKQAGTKEAFAKVDYDYPVEIARISKESGASQYLLVSALGANNASSIFYNRVKGEAEVTIKNIGFETVHIFRPSLLLGDRLEKRSGEQAAKVFYKFFGALFPAKYKAIDAGKVANAMLHFANQSGKGTFIHESAALQAF